MRVTHVSLSLLIPSPKRRPLEKIEELAESLNTLGQLTPILVRPDEKPGFFRIIKGNRRHAAAGLLGWVELGAVIVSGEKEDLSTLAVMLALPEVPLAEKAELLYEARKMYAPKVLAAGVGLSMQHVNNLSRLRSDLAPGAWAQLVKEGQNARSMRWIAIAAMSPANQLKVLQQEGPRARRVRDRRMLTKKLQGLRSNDVRAMVIKWALHEGDWPETRRDRLYIIQGLRSLVGRHGGRYLYSRGKTMAEPAPRMTLADAKEKLEQMGTRLKGMREKVDEQVDVAVTAGVTMAGAGAVGVLDGWSGPEGFKIANVNGKIIVGLAAHAFGMMSGSKYADQFRAFGNGALSAFVFEKGKDWGARMKSNKDAGKPIFSGSEAPPQIGEGNQGGGYGYSAGAIQVAAE